MDPSQKNPDVDWADGIEDPPLGSWIAEAALERWEHQDLARSKHRLPREERR